LDKRIEKDGRGSRYKQLDRLGIALAAALSFFGKAKKKK
jgi:hypothetical protein